MFGLLMIIIGATGALFVWMLAIRPYAAGSRATPSPGVHAPMNKRKLWRVGLVLMSFFVLCVVGFCSRTPDYDALKAQGNTLVAAVEMYHTNHGVYPESLEAAGTKLPWTIFGRWRYVVLVDGKSFRLNLGDYNRDGFALWYTPEGDWYLDT